MRSFAAILLLNFIVVACIEPFESEIPNFESVLVVEGQISDEEKPSEIYLSRSRALNSEEIIPERSATVTLSGAEGEMCFFTETAAGIYQSPDTFRGEIGKSYTLNIETNDGSDYRSDPLIIKKCPPIDSVYFEEEARITDEGEVLSGIAILVDTHDPANASRNYRWEWEESWEVKVPYPSTYVWQDDTSTTSTPTCGWPIPRDHKISLCYNAGKSNQILIESTARLSEDIVNHFELTYVSTVGHRLNSVYSIDVRQRVMDDKAYEYWSEVKKLSETLGTVFDPQPYYIQGNEYVFMAPARCSDCREDGSIEKPEFWPY